MNRFSLRLSAALVILIGLGAASVATGPVPLTLADWLAVLRVDTEAKHAETAAYVLYSLRLPRTIQALAAGALLGFAGCTMQALFRNPLAEPGILGVSAGAAVGAAIIATLLPVWLSDYGFGSLLALGAISGSLANLAFLWVFAVRRPDPHPTPLLLAGVALNAFWGSLLGLLLFFSDDARLRAVTFWTLGSLSGSHWMGALASSVVAVCVGLAARAISAQLDLLLLGDANAVASGLDLKELRRRVVWWNGLAVGTAVAFTGPVGFVGFLAPHWGRQWVGALHRRLLPFSMTLGSSLLLGADIAARRLASPAELPLGTVTGLVGGAVLWRIFVRVRGDL